MVGEPLSRGDQSVLVGRCEPVWHLDQQGGRLTVVGVRDDPGETGCAYLRGKAPPTTGPTLGGFAGVTRFYGRTVLIHSTVSIWSTAQTTLGQIGEERAEAARLRRSPRGERADRGHAQALRPLEPLGAGQPAREQRDRGLVQLVEEHSDLVAEWTASCGTELDDGRGGRR